MKISGRFLGGTDLTPHEFPWLALIINLGAVDHQKSQTGTLINDRYIVTSANQLFGHTPYLYKVTLGYHLMCQSEFTSTVYSVKEIIIHPAFYTETSLNNIAMLKISVPVLFSHHISPICLPTPDSTYNGKVGTVVSWFTGDPTSNSGINPTTAPLQSGDKRCSSIAEQNEGCIGIYGANNIHLCQVSQLEGAVACKKFTVDQGYYELVGVLSNRQWCNQEGTQWKTTSTLQPSSPSEEIDPPPEDREVDEKFRSARFFELSLLAMPTFAKVDNHLEWILKNTKDALYCQKL
ncbi:granzyme G-like [Lutzomyia longipalpis]|uniref:granzyme G-like n=1 Tax=Lutzomyia longipalpis TaxID=7200 RepID=UPI002483496A|nr:granzyme G-like [Lutzomyia longipalpis]